MKQPGSLRLENVVHRVGDWALEASFEVGPGARAVLAGPSGIGKTTLLRVIAGLSPMDSGRIWLGETEISGLDPQKREIGYVSQEAALFQSLTVAENAAFGLRMRGMGAQQRRHKIMPWLEKVGLSAQANERVEWLSGGEKSRVAFVRALVWEPRLLLLDEPFAALDRELKRKLRSDLLTLHAQCPVPMILVTHDEEDDAVLSTLRLSVSEPRPGVRKVQA